MKKTNIFKAIMMMCLMLVGTTVFTACNEDQLDTDQFAGGPVKLLAYGPNPVARMGELRIIGVGLDKVQSVTVPGAGDITEINHISAEEIRITIPNSAVIGKIILNSTSGTVESVTALKYTEPVEITPMADASIKPGEVFTIKGEYLNLVQQVIFAEGVVVDAPFVAQSREEIKVVVPEEAQTGRFAISFCATGDTIPNLINSTFELAVVTPAVDEIANLTGKKPGDLITHKGSNLDLVTRLTVAGEEVEWWFTDDTKHDGIGYELPASTPAQATVSVWPASGVECVIAYIGMQLPTELKAEPAQNVKPGDKIVITGKDLDVVSNVQFAGSAETVGVTNQGTTSLTVVVPADAQSGDLVLNCKSGATATVAIVTAKPALEAYNPAPVNAGSALTITGKNLELVSKITFTDNLTVDAFTAQSATSITLNVPVTAVSGKLIVVMSNGESVEFGECNINSPIFCFIPELPSGEEEIKAGELCKVVVMNADKLTGVQVDGQDCQYILQDDVLYYAVPSNAGPKSVTKLISSNGEVEYKIPFKPNTEIVTTLWSDVKELGWSGDGQVYIGDDGGQSLIDAGAKAGDILRIKLQPLADDWQVQIWEGHWGTMYDEIKADNYDLAGNGYYYNITLTDALLATFTTKQWWGGIVLTQGQQCVVTGLELLQKISLETTIWEGNEDLGSWSNQPYLGNENALIEAGAKPGQKLRIYGKPLADDWMVQIFNGHWDGQVGGDYTAANGFDLAAGIEIVLDANNIKPLTNPSGWGGIFVVQGQNAIITKLTLE